MTTQPTDSLPTEHESGSSLLSPQWSNPSKTILKRSFILNIFKNDCIYRNATELEYIDGFDRETQSPRNNLNKKK